MAGLRSVIRRRVAAFSFNNEGKRAPLTVPHGTLKSPSWIIGTGTSSRKLTVITANGCFCSNSRIIAWCSSGFQKTILLGIIGSLQSSPYITQILLVKSAAANSWIVWTQTNSPLTLQGIAYSAAATSTV